MISNQKYKLATPTTYAIELAVGPNCAAENRQRSMIFEYWPYSIVVLATLGGSAVKSYYVKAP